MLLDPRYLFAIDHVVPHADQLALIEAGRRKGLPHGGLRRAADKFWALQIVKNVDPDSLPASTLEWFRSQPDHQRFRFNAWSYYARFDLSLAWKWVDEEARAILEPILEPVRPLFREITRVNVVLQVPGRVLPSHRDLSPGTEYDGVESPYTTAFGPHRLVWEGEKWLSMPRRIANEDHRVNEFFCLKLPLSERPDDPGLPYVEIDSGKFHYDSHGRVFFLNEVDMLHGADPVDFWRGTVFVNGVMNRRALDALPRLPIEGRPAPTRAGGEGVRVAQDRTPPAPG